MVLCVCAASVVYRCCRQQFSREDIENETRFPPFIPAHVPDGSAIQTQNIVHPCFYIEKHCAPPLRLEKKEEICSLILAPFPFFFYYLFPFDSFVSLSSFKSSTERKVFFHLCLVRHFRGVIPIFRANRFHRNASSCFTIPPGKELFPLAFPISCYLGAIRQS